MSSGEHRPGGGVVLVIGTDRDGVPYRAWMRLNGLPTRNRRRRAGRSVRAAAVCVRCGARASDGIPITLDHIVPQSRLTNLPDVRNHPANHQPLCGNVVEPRDGRRNRVLHRGCNPVKANGRAVDYRGDPDRYAALVRLLAEHGVDEPVVWRPRPYRGVHLPVPTIA